MPIGDLFRVDGSVAIVTGASAGLGVAFAHALADAGASVAIAGRRLEHLDSTRETIEDRGVGALAIRTDVADPEQCANLVQATVDHFGKVDILVNNAGVGSGPPALRESPEEFRQVLDINLHGCYWMAQAFARVAQPGSCIVNLGSMLGQTTDGLPHAAYSASKAGVEGLTRDLAAQWTSRKGIRVNCLAPGYFPSEMSATYPDGFLDGITEQRSLMGRLGRTEELAGTLVWLVSPASGFVTGQVVHVDGGMTIT